jgi:hydrogenase expression/formation protein HypD
LPESVKLISGPGCPVCVTPSGYIDNAFRLVEKHDCTVLSFGDMVKVPAGDGRTLSQFLGSGKVKIVYSPSEISGVAAQSPGPVVFLGIGFETTIPAVVAGFKRAIEAGCDNVFLYTAFKTVPPALEYLLNDPEHRLDGFLLPGHVSVIIGEVAYGFLEGRIAGVIAGFEPLDMLIGLSELLRLVSNGARSVENLYKRAVRPEGNKNAQRLMDEYLEPRDAAWRAIGTIPASGLALRSEYRRFDAAFAFDLPPEEDGHRAGCICGSVIQGKARPTDCALFGDTCTPDRPVGPCMVSSEGTCAAYLRYGS